ncbi:uncharacterized protein M6B38_404985 [Iris pallida]|uniref:Import inner membrane translocase subunit n=1 Tax=Iris pallida TaxID=29817 RepID=A0AAX6FRQ0_IRIPA|nr:uncharacterized protein M6B38_404985 [Iris pallida]
MAKSTKQIIKSLHRLCIHEIIPSKPILQSPTIFPLSQSRFLIPHHKPSNFFSSPSILSRRAFSTQAPSKNGFLLPRMIPSQTQKTGSLLLLLLPRRSPSARNISSGKFRALGNPLELAKSAASRYRDAAGLQLEAFWNRNYLVFVGAGAVVVCIALWRLLFGVANTFVGLSEGMAKYGFLALSTAIVAFVGMYIRSRLTINPDKIYRLAMRKLNTSAGILEVMGAPLTGTEVRAYVMSGGGPKLKDFKFRVGGKRCFLIFPIRGSERRGLVSVEVKKKKGQYDMKLLAVDIPMAAGPDQRIFLIGDEQEYKVGGGLISELRDPIVKAMAAEKEFEDLDEQEEEEDEIREREEAEREQQEEEERAIEAAAKRR